VTPQSADHNLNPYVRLQRHYSNTHLTNVDTASILYSESFELLLIQIYLELLILSASSSYNISSVDPLVACMGRLSVTPKTSTRVTATIPSILSAPFNQLSPPVHKHQYILPTVDGKRVQKITILDPVLSHGQYILPTSTKIIQEKVSPSMNNVHKKAPTIQNNNIRKEATKPKWGLVIIRHKKMKKHQLKKLRKRMYYTWKKEAEVKNRKKEKKMQLYEEEWKKLGQSFDAESFVSERIDAAKKGGWGVNVFEGRR